MQKRTISTFTNGRYEITITPSLRDQFAEKHATMSGSKPGSKQYPYDEQKKMYEICVASKAGAKGQIDWVKTEDNLLELIHFLDANGVAIPDIIPAIRRYSERTLGISMRLHVLEVEAHKIATKAAREAARAAEAQANALFSHRLVLA